MGLRARGVMQGDGTVWQLEEQDWPPQAPPSLLLHPTALPRDQKRLSPLWGTRTAPLCCVCTPGGSCALSGPTPCTHVGQDPAVTQQAGTLGAGEVAELHGRQTGAAGRAEHTGRVAPAPPGHQPAPSGLRGSRGAVLRTPAQGSARTSRPLLTHRRSMARASAELSQEGGCREG